MKKKVLLLITLVVSLFIYSGKVGAAKELTCIYDEDDSKIMLFQDSNGNIDLIEKNKNSKALNLNDLNDPGWDYYDYINEKKVNDKKIEFDTLKYDGARKIINNCPNVVEKRNNEIFSFYDEKSDDQINLKYNYGYLPKNIDYTSDVNLDYDSKIKNTEWLAKCVYGNATMYFSKDDFLLFDQSHSSNYISLFSLDSLLLSFSGACPPALYYIDYGCDSAPENLSFDQCGVYFNFDKLDFGSFSAGNRLVITEKQYFDNNSIIDNGNCDDLLCQDTIDKISGYFNVIKIIIPILLIGYGIFDFSKAVFGKEDDMKKAKKNFVLRIVAAVLFFLSPIFIKLILSIANSVWHFISPNTYIK